MDIQQYLIIPFKLTERQSLIYITLYKKCNFYDMTVEITIDQIRTSISLVELTNKMITSDMKKMCEAGYLDLIKRGKKGTPSIYKIIKIKDIENNNEVTNRSLIGNQSVTNRSLIGNLSVSNNLAIPSDTEDSRSLIGNQSVTNRSLIGNQSVTNWSTYSKDKDKDKDNDNDIYTDTTKENEASLLKEESKPASKEKTISLKDVTFPHYIKTEEEKIIYLLNYALDNGQRFNTRKSNAGQLITKLLMQGYKLEDFILVIEHKVSQWKGTSQSLNLKPTVLFSDSFKYYLQEAKGALPKTMPKVREDIKVLGCYKESIDRLIEDDGYDTRYKAKIVKTLPLKVKEGAKVRMRKTAAPKGAGAYNNDMVEKAGVKNDIELEKYLKKMQKDKGM